MDKIIYSGFIRPDGTPRGLGADFDVDGMGYVRLCVKHREYLYQACFRIEKGIRVAFDEAIDYLLMIYGLQRNCDIDQALRATYDAFAKRYPNLNTVRARKSFKRDMAVRRGAIFSNPIINFENDFYLNKDGSPRYLTLTRIRRGNKLVFRIARGPDDEKSMTSRLFLQEANSLVNRFNEAVDKLCEFMEIPVGSSAHQKYRASYRAFIKRYKTVLREAGYL